MNQLLKFRDIRWTRCELLSKSWADQDGDPRKDCHLQSSSASAPSATDCGVFLDRIKDSGDVFFALEGRI